MAEHHLDRANVHSIAQEPTGALVTEVVPVQVQEALALWEERERRRLEIYRTVTTASFEGPLCPQALNACTRTK